MLRPLPLFLLAVAILNDLQCIDWSKIDYEKYCVKEEPDNTPCVTKCRVGVNCGTPITNFKELNIHEKQFLLDLHNQLREKVARGDYASAGFPAATNMHALNWDAECEMMTTCWLRQCNFWHDKHVKPNGEMFGQNLHERYTSARFRNIDHTWLEHGIMAWFNEYKLLKDHPKIYENFQPVKGTGHFTAMIWHEVQLVGCATNHFKRGGKEWFQLFCNYFPSGNWRNAPIYSTAPHDCKRGSKYTHLCGEAHDVSKATPSHASCRLLLLAALLLTTL